MDIYTVYTRPNDTNPLENSIFIKEGFSWFAALLHVFWALYHKMWLVSVVLFTVESTLTFLQMKGYIQMGVGEALKVGVLLLIGVNFNDWHRFAIEQKGYVFQGVVSGKNEDAARHKYITEMVQRSTLGSGKTSSAMV